jgi:hypothetical protein
MSKTNCWEYLKCGLEDKCPAYPKHGCDCWNVTGTVCCGDARSGYDDKIGHCRVACNYYNGVMMGAVKLT